MALSYINGIGEVLAHYLGCETLPGGEITCVYGLAQDIYNGDKAGPVKEMYHGGHHVHVVRAFVKDVGLEGSVCCTG